MYNCLTSRLSRVSRHYQEHVNPVVDPVLVQQGLTWSLDLAQPIGLHSLFAEHDILWQEFLLAHDLLEDLPLALEHILHLSSALHHALKFECQFQ